MNLETFEDAIISRLKDQISNIQIESFPQDPIEYQLTHAKGAVLVRYNNSDYTEPEPNEEGIAVTPRRLNWTINIAQRGLRYQDAHQGIYSILEQIRVALTGYTPTGFQDSSILWPTGDAFLFEEDGIWWYYINFANDYPEAET